MNGNRRQYRFYKSGVGAEGTIITDGLSRKQIGGV
jgi:hypothetical protein